MSRSEAIAKVAGWNDHRKDAIWPYPTNDEVSHLVLKDYRLLIVRIDMLLEERRQLRQNLGYCEVVLPTQWKLTPLESRFITALVSSHLEVVSKDQIHRGLNPGVDPDYDSEPQIVNVVCCHVRKKLTPFGVSIETHWGKGYSLDAKTKAALKLTSTIPD